MGKWEIRIRKMGIMANNGTMGNKDKKNRNIRK